MLSCEQLLRLPSPHSLIQPCGSNCIQTCGRPDIRSSLKHGAVLIGMRFSIRRPFHTTVSVRSLAYGLSCVCLYPLMKGCLPNRTCKVKYLWPNLYRFSATWQLVASLWQLVASFLSVFGWIFCLILHPSDELCRSVFSLTASEGNALIRPKADVCVLKDTARCPLSNSKAFG